MKNQYVLLSTVCCGLFFSCEALAQCVAKKDCNSLGYKQTSCESGKGIKCPFGEAWYCPIDTNCLIGRIYYADDSCSTPEAYNSSKIALGVVVYVNPNGVGGQVMTKENIGKYDWGGFDYDAPVSDITDWTVAQKDYDSCGNTDKLLGDSQFHPAAQAARSYTPTPETKGKWCLPAAGILSSWYVNREAIDVAIGVLGGTQLGSTDPEIWSSSEYRAMEAWQLNKSRGKSTGGIVGYMNAKSNSDEVRPVINF